MLFRSPFPSCWPPRFRGLGVILASILVAGFTERAHAQSTAPPDFDSPILATQLPIRTAAEQSASSSGGMLPNAWGVGGQIVLLSPGAPPHVLPTGLHSACDPQLSFDGKQLLLAGRKSAEDSWNIYEMTVDGSGLRQITRGIGDCRNPNYQSDYYQISDEDVAWRQITFVRSSSDERNEYGTAPVTSIYSCKLDGTDVTRLTFNLSSDRDPHLTWDGRLVYASWQRRTLQHGLPGRIVLLGINVDGTDGGPMVVDSGRRIKQMPCSTSNGLLIFVEADRVAWDGAGALSCVSLRRPIHTYRQLTQPADGLFHSPSALPDGKILVSRRTADGTEPHAVYRFDPDSKQMDRLFGDAQHHYLQAQCVAERPLPDGRSSSVNKSDPRGKLFCMDVYTNDLNKSSWMPRGAVKKVRILQGIPRSMPDSAGDTAGNARKLAERRLLGEVPVEADGSFHVEIPANTPIELQLLDEDEISLRSCGWIWTPNHFNQGCIGCHEDPELTPENRMVLALEKPAAPAFPPEPLRPAIDFRRDLMPVIQQKCLPCHGPEGSPPLLTDAVPSSSDAAATQSARVVYERLLASAEPAGPPHRGQYVDPGRARTSPLVWHLFGRNLARPWDAPATDLPAQPIPPDATISLTAEERVNFVKWIDFGASWTAQPIPGKASPN